MRGSPTVTIERVAIKSFNLVFVEIRSTRYTRFSTMLTPEKLDVTNRLTQTKNPSKAARLDRELM